MILDRADTGCVSVVVGGIYVDRAATKSANEVCRELRHVNGKPDLTDYYVDLCFMTYVEDGLGSTDAKGRGIAPMMVGRLQRRFIVSIEVPPGLAGQDAYRAWMVTALSEVAALVREYLPRKGKAYPAERLANEVDELRARWRVHVAART